MPSAADYPSRGRVREATAERVIFLPEGTTYELHLKPAGGAFSGPLDRPIDVLIRVDARKIWTVPSGGNFIQPIFGPPRIIQGRVKWLDERTLVVHAGANFIITLPEKDSTIDLANGPIEAGAMVNVTAMPGVTIEARDAAVAAT